MTCCRCNQLANAWMTFEYATSSIALLDLTDVTDRYGGYAMCERHAGRLTPPVGWQLRDHREVAMTLFSLIEHSAEAAISADPQPESDVA